MSCENISSTSISRCEGLAMADTLEKVVISQTQTCCFSVVVGGENMHGSRELSTSSRTSPLTVMPPPHNNTHTTESTPYRPAVCRTCASAFLVAAWQVCESLAVSAGSQEKAAIGAMFEREMKQEKNLEVTHMNGIVLYGNNETSACLHARRNLLFLSPTRSHTTLVSMHVVQPRSSSCPGERVTAMFELTQSKENVQNAFRHTRINNFIF